MRGASGHEEELEELRDPFPVIEHPDTTGVLLTGHIARVDHVGNRIINVASRHRYLALKGM